MLGWHLDAPAPAPWYGSIAAQLGTVALLLGLFVAIARRPRTEAVRHGVAATRARVATGIAGIVATLTVLAALTEIAMLGDTHAAFLIGGPTVESASFLMQVARAAVAVTALAALNAGALELRARRTGGSGKGIIIGAASIGYLVVWAAYWGLAPLA